MSFRRVATLARGGTRRIDDERGRIGDGDPADAHVDAPTQPRGDTRTDGDALGGEQRSREPLFQQALHQVRQFSAALLIGTYF